MPNKRDLPFFIFRVALLILIAGMPWSRALTSISGALLFISAMAEIIINKVRIPTNKYFLCLILLVLLFLLDGLRAGSLSDWFYYVNIRIPLVMLPLSILVFKPKITTEFMLQVSIIFCITIAFATIASSINYILNYKELNALVLHSKPIPIIGQIHHITFSVYCAFAVIVSAFYAWFNKIKWLWVLTIINLAGLHILTARTGLAGFYFACLVLGSVYIINHKPKIRYLILSLVTICVLPVIAFYSLGSFHNRVLNSWEDMKGIWHQKDANYQSMGMRIEASKTAFDLIKKYPITGVGCTNLNHAMSVQYEENNSNLFLENRIMPHNQFVMETAIHGFIGLAILVLFFAFPFFDNFLRLPTLFISLWSLLFFGCMFECLFDRQHGVILVGLFWFLFYEQATKIKSI